MCSPELRFSRDRSQSPRRRNQYSIPGFAPTSSLNPRDERTQSRSQPFVVRRAGRGCFRGLLDPCGAASRAARTSGRPSGRLAQETRPRGVKTSPKCGRGWIASASSVDLPRQRFPSGFRYPIATMPGALSVLGSSRSGPPQWSCGCTPVRLRPAWFSPIEANPRCVRKLPSKLRLRRPRGHVTATIEPNFDRLAGSTVEEGDRDGRRRGFRPERFDRKSA